MAPYVPSGPAPTGSELDVQTRSERTLTIACCCLVGVTVILRTLGRYCLNLKIKHENFRVESLLGWDDIFNFIAVALFYGFATVELIAIKRGMGIHIKALMYYRGPDSINEYSFAIYLCALFYNATLGFVKLSVLGLYRRILTGVPSKILTIANWSIFALVCVNTSVNVFIAAFQCTPIEAAWNVSIADKTCINSSAFYIGNSITGIITDILVYGLSIPIIRPLQMDHKTKLQTLLTLLVGTFAVVTSCVRLGFLPSLLVNPDATWAMGVPMDWSVVEPTVGIIVSSMPAIRSVRWLWSRERLNSSLNSKSHNLTSTSGKHGRHIQLGDYAPNGANTTGHKTSVVAGHWDSGKSTDGDSGRDIVTYGDNMSDEEALVYGKDGGITRKTDVKVEYNAR